MNRIFGHLFAVTAITSLVVSIVIWVVDLFVPLGLTVTALYVIPILISLLADDRMLTFNITALCTALTIFGYFLSPDGGVSAGVVVADRSIVVFVLWTTALLGTELTTAKRQISALEKLLDQERKGWRTMDSN